jgi:glycosyltransferase involved in cell wall biosynthesis
MGHSNKVPLSVLIPVKNEYLNLERCLQSINWADEIFVVDSQSTDGTQEIAKKFNARVVQFNFSGIWPKKKNWALENLPFKHDWVFIIDADEALPPMAAEEFREVVENENDSVSGYWLNRRFHFMGKWLKHAYYPNWNLRLFKHRLGRFEKMTNLATDSGDNEVHEHVIIQGETGRLKTEMDHFAFPSVAAFVEKHNRYSNWEARVALGNNGLIASDPSLQNTGVNFRRSLKRWSRILPFRPWLRFFYVFIFQGGFLDGREGYYFARLHGYYEFLNQAKFYELKKEKKT